MSTPTKPAADTPAVTTTPTPPPAETPAAPPTPTPDEITEEAKQFFIDSAFSDGRRDKKPEPKPEPAPAPEPPKAEEPKPEPAPPEKRDKKRFVPVKKAVSAEEAETIARRVQAEREQATPEPEPSKPEPLPPPPTPVDDLAGIPDEEQDHLQILAEVEKSNPAQKGLVDRQKKFYRAVEARRKEWEEKNGEGSYNPDDTDHAEFYRKGEPFVLTRDIETAKRSMIARDVEDRVLKRAEENIRKEFEPKLKKYEEAEARRVAEEERQKIEPLVADAQADAVEAVFQAVPEFKDLFKPKELTKEVVEKLKEINPYVHEFVTEEAEIAYGVVGELERLEKLEGQYQRSESAAFQTSTGRVVDPDVIINHLFQRMERTMSDAPKQERLVEGKAWISLGERTQRHQEILKSTSTPEAKKRQLDDLYATTWTISPQHVQNTFLNMAVDRVTKAAARHASYAKPPTPPTSPNGAPAAPLSAPPKQSAKADLPRGTSTSTVSDTADNSEAARTQVEKEKERFLKSAF